MENEVISLDDYHDDEQPTTKQCCNMQIALSYILSIVSSLVIVHGSVLYLKTWNKEWLMLPAFGIILTLVGSCIYRCGVLNLEKNKYSKVKKRNRRRVKRTIRQSHLFESHLSLNMLPQCFSNFETARILNPNGLGYLPVDPTNSQNEVRLENLTNTDEPNRSAVKSQRTAQNQSNELSGDRDVDDGELESVSRDLVTVAQTNDHSEESNTDPDQSRINVVRADQQPTDQSSPNEQNILTRTPSFGSCTGATEQSLSEQEQNGTSLIGPSDSSTSSISGEQVTNEPNSSCIALDEVPPSYEEVLNTDHVVEHYQTL